MTMSMKPLDETALDQLQHWPLEQRLARLEQQAATTLTERRRVTRLQRSQLRSVVALLALLIGVGAVFYHHLDHAQGLAKSALNRAESRHRALRAYQIASCKRGNETRVGDNRAHLQNYQFDREIIALIAAAPAQHVPRTAQQAHSEQLARLFLHNLSVAADSLEWRHLVQNCVAAVDDPGKYVVPPPEKFSQHMPGYAVLHVIDDPRQGLIE